MVSQHPAGRTEYGVTNDDVENVEQQSKHVLVLKLVFQIFVYRGLCQGLQRMYNNSRSMSWF